MNIKKFKGKNKKGKKILVIGGVHGDELTPIYSVYLYQKYLKSNKKRDFKSLTIINSINKSGIENCTREMSNNNTSDLNRKLSHENFSPTDKLKELIEKNDVIIDCHSSPKCCDFVLLNMDEYNNSYVKFCEKNNINYLNRYSNANTIKKYALDMDKISFTIELNKMNYVDIESAKSGKDLISNIVENINSMKYKKSEPKYEPYTEFNHHKSGIFFPKHKLGEVISKGDKIGYILDLTTYEKHKVIFNRDGDYRLICQGISDYITPKDSIYYIQKL